MYDWMILFFVHEISEDLPESKEMYDIIQRYGGSENNVVFLIKDSISQKEDEQHFSFRLGVWRLEKKKGSEAYELSPVQGLQIDNKDRRCWDQAFKFIFKHFYSRRKMLITFSHGAAFGINRDLKHIHRPPGQRLAGQAANPSGNVTEVRGRSYLLDRTDILRLKERGALSDGSQVVSSRDNEEVFVVRKPAEDPLCKALEVLWISDLAASLERRLDDAHIDVLLMVNCYMQLFDNGYLLRNKVSYMIAPEGKMLAIGYDYKKIFETLRSTPEITNKQLVTKIVRDYVQMYMGMEGGPDYLSTNELSANDLQYYSVALKGFEKFVKLLRCHIPELIEDLQEIRNNQMDTVSGSESYQLVDAGLWIRLVAEMFPGNRDFQEFARWFRRLHERMVVAKHIGEGLKQHDASQSRKYGYSGISILYPDSRFDFKDSQVAWCAYFDKSMPPEFGQRSRWSSFLRHYLKLSAPPAAE
jgi:hypothetical protein